MFRSIFFIFVLLFKTSTLFAQGYDVFGLGIYDVKFDGSSSNYATDIRYERRFDNTLFDIGPEVDNFFYLKPFFGIEATTDSAIYFLGGIYLEDNLGKLFVPNSSRQNPTKNTPRQKAMDPLILNFP